MRAAGVHILGRRYFVHGAVDVRRAAAYLLQCVGEPVQWSPAIHSIWPAAFQRAVFTLLCMCGQDTRTGRPWYPQALMSQLPHDVLLVMIAHLANTWVLR